MSAWTCGPKCPCWCGEKCGEFRECIADPEQTINTRLGDKCEDSLDDWERWLEESREEAKLCNRRVKALRAAIAARKAAENEATPKTVEPDPIVVCPQCGTPVEQLASGDYWCPHCERSWPYQGTMPCAPWKPGEEEKT